MLVQKKQVKPIELKGVKPKAMSQEDWNDLDELARSTIMLILSKSVYFNVKEMKTNYTLWNKLSSLYEQKNIASLVYWLKQLVDLKMKDGTTMFCISMTSVPYLANLVCKVWSSMIP